MAVSKRKRYEVFRRDSFTCRYCGRSAPDVELTVDHVNPQTLVEDDATTNLVTACKDCNLGKSSVPPDAPLVADVEEKALQWSRAMNTVLDQRAAERAGEQVHLDRFDTAWKEWQDGVGDEFPRDPDWRTTIRGYLAQGLDHADFLEAIEIAMSKRDVRWDAKWKYFNGCCRNVAKDIVDRVAVETRNSTPSTAASKSYINEDGEDEGKFPEFEVTCEYLEHLVHALGGDAQVAKYVDRTVGTALSTASNAWYGGIRDSEEDTIELVRASVREAAAGHMTEIRKWREQRDRGWRFPAMNLADTFINGLLEAFDATAEDRQKVHHAYWQAMEHAYRAYTQDEIPEGYDEHDWVELDFGCAMEEHLGDDVGQRRNHIVQVALARHYVQRVCELGHVEPELAREMALHVACVLNEGTQEFAAASQRHPDITDHQALDCATRVMDEDIDKQLVQGDVAAEVKV